MGYILPMDFEYDENKSRANELKHGLNFDEAQSLWSDPERLEIPARSTDEPRYILIGLICQQHWSAVVTYRGQTVRLISVRRSRKEEVRLYESIEL
jgi:uncharacterized protein